MKPTILFSCSDTDNRTTLLQQFELDGYPFNETTLKQLVNQDNPQAHLPALFLVCANTAMDIPASQIRQLQDTHPLPIVIFLEDCDQAAITEYIIAGVTSLIVDNFEPHRFDSIIKTAITRFEKCQHLHLKLSDAEQKLEDRRTVEKAKGIIMTGKQLSEDDAYKLLRSMAMEKNIKMGDLAKSVIAASELLT
ncbi:MAG: Response regulator receiver and ANTAR domain protein [uncultured Thiotrichaceae bacterium]|uniref:Response regulator receiver and ANTAR domain protein n=1 Tax=uncultured Thiotrichaceae bacterium TaxID=298394 RepID=A0A6S6SWE1_9GAMM|nr:MAG: Response regulator receiver and ANTAR domain protein [uncultured Thiotrichaceae bacterium]